MKTIKDCFASIWKSKPDGTCEIYCVDENFKRLPDNVTDELLLKYATHNDRHPTSATRFGTLHFPAEKLA
jgi:hypothetical protein